MGRLCLTKQNSDRSFHFTHDFAFTTPVDRAFSKSVLRVEFFKKKYLITTKTVGSVNIEISKLQGCTDYSGKVALDYKGSPMELHVSDSVYKV